MKEIILITGANGHLAQMLGNYLKDVYSNRVYKGAYNVGDGYSQS